MTRLRWGSSTHVGRVRSQNQDASLEAEPIFAVADGMGGAAGGEVAAHIAIETMRAAAEPSEEGLAEGIRRANRAVLARAGDDPGLRGMGTTMSAIALVTDGADDGTGTGGDRIAVANVGDSRVYLFHDGDLMQITRDHSLVEDLVEEGRLSEEEARYHPHKNILTRVLGNETELDVDTWEVVPYTGDRFLLCSDGLVNEVDDESIAGVLRTVDDPQEVADALVEMANDAGGHDNITVVVVDVVDDGGRSAQASSSLAASSAAGSAAGRAGGGADADSDGDGDASGDAGGGDLPAGRPGARQPRRFRRRSDPSGGPERSGATSDDGGRAPRLTWRVVAFMVAVLLVLGGAAATVVWYGRSGWYVGVAGDDVAVYQGRPGGVLWFEPTLERRTELQVDDLPEARRDAVREGKEEPSLAAALRYIDNLREQAEQERRRTTTTTTTTAPPPPPPTTAAPPPPGAP